MGRVAFRDCQFVSAAGKYLSAHAGRTVSATCTDVAPASVIAGEKIAAGVKFPVPGSIDTS